MKNDADAIAPEELGCNVDDIYPVFERCRKCIHLVDVTKDHPGMVEKGYKLFLCKRDYTFCPVKVSETLL